MEVGGHIPDEVDGAGDVTSEAAEGLEASHGDETLAPKADAVGLSSTNDTIVRGVDDAAYGDMDSESFPPEPPQQPDAEDGEVVSCDNGSLSAGGTATSSLSPASDWEMLDEEGRVSPTAEVTMARTGLDNDSDDIEQSGKAKERMEAIAEAIVKDALEGALIRSATHEHAVIPQEEDGEEDEIVGDEKVDGLDAAMTEVSDEMRDSQYSDDIQPEYPGAYEYTAGDEIEGYTERISPANGDSSPYDDVGGVVEPDDFRIIKSQLSTWQSVLSTCQPFGLTSKMSGSDELIQGVIETIDSTSQHRMQLTELYRTLEEARTQIETSANVSRNRLKSHFDNLRTCICKALDSRLADLESQITTTEESSLVPLIQCREILQQSLNTASDVMKEGKRLLMDETNDNRLAMYDFKKQTDHLGLDSLPDVPSLAEVACISVDLPGEQEDQTAEDQLLEAIKDYGRVISRAPAQISEVSERPGGLFVAWTETDEEQELCEFRLQRCNGNVKSGDESSHNFVTVYQGTASSCVVRHLKPISPYTFRVCGRGEGTDSWSPWSIPCVGMTTLSPYEWEAKAVGYSVNPELNIAERISNLDDNAVVLYSRAPCYTCGHSVVFRVLECGASCVDDGVAICANKSEGSQLNESCIFVNTEGAVSLDGKERITRLPPLTQGTTLTFDTEVLQSKKVRVTVEVDEKILTFDWTIESNFPPSSPLMGGGFGGVQYPMGSPESSLYFAAKFKEHGWKIAVE